MSYRLGKFLSFFELIKFCIFAYINNKRKRRNRKKLKNKEPFQSRLKRSNIETIINNLALKICYIFRQTRLGFSFMPYGRELLFYMFAGLVAEPSEYVRITSALFFCVDNSMLIFITSTLYNMKPIKKNIFHPP